HLPAPSATTAKRRSSASITHASNCTGLQKPTTNFQHERAMSTRQDSTLLILAWKPLHHTSPIIVAACYDGKSTTNINEIKNKIYKATTNLFIRKSKISTEFKTFDDHPPTT